MMNFEATVSALCYSFIDQQSKDASTETFPHNQVVRFVLAQHRNMPDYLRWPLVILTGLFGLSSIFTQGQRFHRLPVTARTHQILVWKTSPIKVCRDLIRFYESLSVFGWYARTEETT